MKYVLALVCSCLLGCSVHRDVDSSVQKRREDNLQLDATNVRDLGSISVRERLFQGGYMLKGNWRIYDTSAPQLPDGSFPILAEGSTEEQGTVEEKEKSRKETISRDSSNVSVTASGVESEDRDVSERTGGEIGIGWLNALIWGVCIGFVLIGLLWWKYGKKN